MTCLNKNHCSTSYCIILLKQNPSLYYPDVLGGWQRVELTCFLSLSHCIPTLSNRRFSLLFSPLMCGTQFGNAWKRTRLKERKMTLRFYWSLCSIYRLVFIDLQVFIEFCYHLNLKKSTLSSCPMPVCFKQCLQLEFSETLSEKKTYFQKCI